MKSVLIILALLVCCRYISGEYDTDNQAWKIFWVYDNVCNGPLTLDSCYSYEEMSYYVTCGDGMSHTYDNITYSDCYYSIYSETECYDIVENKKQIKVYNYENICISTKNTKYEFMAIRNFCTGDTNDYSDVYFYLVIISLCILLILGFLTLGSSILVLLIIPNRLLTKHDESRDT